MGDKPLSVRFTAATPSMLPDRIRAGTMPEPARFGWIRGDAEVRDTADAGGASVLIVPPPVRAGRDRAASDSRGAQRDGARGGEFMDGPLDAMAYVPGEGPGESRVAWRKADQPRDAEGFIARTPHDFGRIQRSILKVAHSACDAGQLDVAASLLQVCETLASKDPDHRQRRRMTAAIVAAHERLWRLRHPDGV